MWRGVLQLNFTICMGMENLQSQEEYLYCNFIEIIMLNHASFTKMRPYQSWADRLKPPSVK